MRRCRSVLVIAVALAFSMIAAACGGNGDDSEDNGEDAGQAQKGGTLRVAVEDFGFTGAFDPTGEYLGSAWGMYSNLLLRTLVTYRHVAGPDGNELVPDLAEDMPEISDDELTYTFTLKDGIEFGPPVDRPITAQDVVYAFERIADPKLAAQYGFYYDSTIEGMQEFKDGKADSISGIEAPDDKTIVFTLTKPTGDFPYRLAMPATAPIPEEVGKCATKAGDYGRFVISSGPYMIEGSDELDISSCNAMKPITGFDPNKRLAFVRNPNYDPATDSPEVREALPDAVEFLINTNTKDIFNKIEAGELDAELSSGEPAQVLREYSTNDELSDRIQTHSADRTWYVTMNLTQPPFDDIHVRMAANLVMDKDGLHRAWGGSIKGDIATHIVPPVLTGGTPTAEEFDPYPSENFVGDVEAAKEHMRLSKYDTDKDGMCDAPVCEGILHITRNVPPWTDMIPIVESSMEKIGISLSTRELESGTAYTTIQTVNKNVPFATNAGWGKDYADPSTFMVLFDSRSIIPEGNVNYSLVGLTGALADETGAAGTLTGIPNVDKDIDACNELADQERTDCWIELDKKLMEEVVPWVPYLWAKNVDIISEAVTKYEYDQFSGYPAWSHMAVDESAQS